MSTPVNPATVGQIRLAARAQSFKPSPVRDVFEISMEPGMISLAGGNPDLSLMPRDWMVDVTRQAVTERGADVLQYGSGYGTDAARAAAVQVMAAQGLGTTGAGAGITPQDRHVQMVAGSQMGLDVLLKLLADPGDVILTEDLSYTGALGLFAGHGVQCVGVPTDDDGLIPDALTDTIARVQATGKKICGLYTIPDFSNPTGITLAAARRPRVVEICRGAGIPVLEDAPYRMLSFTDGYQPALWEFDPDWVFHLGSFSKILSPGLRLGWILSPAAMAESVRIASEASIICPSVLSQEIAAAFVARPTWQTEVRAASAAYAQRAQATLDAVAEFLPAGVHATRPGGGFFTWLTLPDGTDVTRVLDVAIDRKVVFVPGDSFSPAGAAPGQLRLAFSMIAPERLREGVARLGSAIGQVVDD